MQEKMYTLGKFLEYVKLITILLGPIMLCENIFHFIRYKKRYNNTSMSEQKNVDVQELDLFCDGKHSVPSKVKSTIIVVIGFTVIGAISFFEKLNVYNFFTNKVITISAGNE